MAFGFVVRWLSKLVLGLVHRNIRMGKKIEKEWCFSWVTQKPAATGTEKAALVRGFKWTPGESITVSFLDGEPSLQQRVKDMALNWTKLDMANLILDFRNTTDTMVRISFRFSGFSSLIGTDCKSLADLSLPTMKLGFVGTPSEETLRRKVLHEFGHVLGLDHEHKSPSNGIQWNRAQVIKELSGAPNFFSEPEIEFNMFQPLANDLTNFSAFDPDSIMIYPIPKNWTTNGFTVGLNTTISATDKNFISNQYPQ